MKKGRKCHLGSVFKSALKVRGTTARNLGTNMKLRRLIHDVPEETKHMIKTGEDRGGRKRDNEKIGLNLAKATKGMGRRNLVSE